MAITPKQKQHTGVVIGACLAGIMLAAGGYYFLAQHLHGTQPSSPSSETPISSKNPTEEPSSPPATSLSPLIIENVVNAPTYDLFEAEKKNLIHTSTSETTPPASFPKFDPEAEALAKGETFVGLDADPLGTNKQPPSLPKPEPIGVSNTAPTPTTGGFESTGLIIQHTPYIVFPKNSGIPRNKKRINCPIQYQSKLLAWNKQQVEEAKTITKELRKLQQEIQACQEKSKHLLGKWNNLVQQGLPVDVLLPDSVSLPANEGVTEALETEEDNLGTKTTITY